MPPRKLSFPNESAEYRSARDDLLQAERELRIAVERVAALRAGLPPGGKVKEDYVFERLDAGGGVESVRLSELFEPGRDTLFLYGFMYGPDAEKACPMCSSLLDALDGNVPHLRERLSVGIVAKSPIRRVVEFACARGWRHLPMLSSANGSYNRDYYGEVESGKQTSMANVFTKRDGTVRHFWGSELRDAPRPSGDPRHVDALWPLWNVLDLTPAGRGDSWRPSLEAAPAVPR